MGVCVRFTSVVWRSLRLIGWRASRRRRESTSTSWYPVSQSSGSLSHLSWLTHLPRVIATHPLAVMLAGCGRLTTALSAITPATVDTSDRAGTIRPARLTDEDVGPVPTYYAAVRSKLCNFNTNCDCDLLSWKFALRITFTSILVFLHLSVFFFRNPYR